MELMEHLEMGEVPRGHCCSPWIQPSLKLHYPWTLTNKPFKYSSIIKVRK